MFRGSFERSVDSKGRVSVPSKFREILAERYDGRLVLAMDLQVLAVGKASGRVLTADRITAHNTFEAPSVVEPRPLAGIAVANSGLSLVLPARSVAVLEIEGP